MKRNLIAAALCGLFVLGACGGGSEEPAATGGAEESPTAEEVPSGEVNYFATEFAFEGPDTIGAGETTFTLTNQGDEPHMLVMVELLDGKTIEDVNTYLEEEGANARPPKWAKQVKVEAFAKPGKSDTAKPVELTPGTYAMLCFVRSKEEKKLHVDLGMTKQITVE